MNGHIASAVALVCAGNQFLAGQNIEGFWPDAPVFNFMKLIEFRQPPSSGKDADDFPLVASDPMEWFEQLKPWRRGLRLHQIVPTRGPDQQLDVPDRMLAGFVGGGQRWLIEAAGETESEIWEPFHRVGDQNDPERRIWKCTYILQWKAPRADVDADAGPTLDTAVAAFRKSLVHIETYARDEKYDNFADIFNEATDTIDAGKPAIEQGDMGRFTGFDDKQAAIFEACSRAWVFGGMGSWNDLGGGERYDRVSQALYDSLNACIAALANSTFRG
ncbi:MAG: hypothetical protein IPO30_10830 [Hyphomonadaceae bacterium]|nr:hypothetical protein [Hyphomonadaceae bacterium]